MKVRSSTSAVVAIATLIGACGRIGYDPDGPSALDSGSGGADVAGGTLAGGSLGSPVSTAASSTTGIGSTGTAGSGGDGSQSSVGGASGATATTDSGGAVGGGGLPAVDGSGGSGGTGGASAGAGGVDGDAGITGTPGGAGQGGAGGASGVCVDNAPISLLYRRYSTVDGPISLGFKVANNTGAPLPLREMKVRYFFTNEVGTPTAAIQYGDICCPDTNIFGHVNVAVVSLSPQAPTADMYIEIGFDSGAGSLDTGHAVEVEVDLRGSTPGIPNQANDYSYIASATGTQAQWDACPGSRNCATFRSCVMTVLVGGAVVWGAPP